MALFEQYERAASVSTGYPPRQPLVPEMTAAGLINAKLEDDEPMFSKQKFNLSFRSIDSITNMTVCNNQLTLGMKNRIRRINVLHPESFDDVNIPVRSNEDVIIYDLFMDPTGKHLLMSLVNVETLGPVENMYLFHVSKKPQQASKLKGHVISAVAWNYQNESENSTGSILIGTTGGFIFETELVYEERPFFQSTPDQFLKQVYDIGASCDDKLGNSSAAEAGTITGLAFYKVPSGKYIVLATTKCRIMQFIGSSTATDPPILQNVFNNYKDLPEGFVELPGSLPYSKLQLFYSSSECPKLLAWMTEPGVMISELNHEDPKTLQETLPGHKLLSYKEGRSTSKQNPLSIVLTEFHLLVLFPDGVKIFSVLDKQLVYKDVFTELYGSLLGIVKDPIKGTIWAYSEVAVYQYSVVREDRNVWEYYLQIGEFEKAKIYCKNDKIKLDKVLTKQAETFFEQEEYENSARIYAETHGSFEAIALKFLQAEQEEAMKVFLLEKLSRLNKTEKTQITMTFLWLLELYLNKLGMLRNSGRHRLDSYQAVQREFHALFELEKVKNCITDNKGAIYKMMTSHGDEENLIYFTKTTKDYDRMIQYHMEQKDYAAALKTLAKQLCSPLCELLPCTWRAKNVQRPIACQKGKVDSFYKFSPALIQAIPQKTITEWITQGRRLEPQRLIPALVQYDDQKDTGEVNCAIHYLEHCIYKLECSDPAVHNYLLALYAHLQPEKLMTYLELYGQDPDSVPYDQKFALRLCSELGLDKACIHIYTTMGLYEEAVDLALKVDIALAKQSANLPYDNEELKKKLWLKIAKHIVKEENDIKKAMESLQQCDLIKIEDILPFFPDFVTIDHFKDAICLSLQKYNEHIESLKEEMEEATQSAQDIRTEIQTFRSRCSVVRAEQKCSLCSYPIVARSFYIFPCRHMFHSDCLINEVRPYLLQTSRHRLEEIQKQLPSLSGREDTASISSATTMSAAISSKDKISAELDDLVASECVLCGEMMIRSIDVPFIPLDIYSEIFKTWK